MRVWMEYWQMACCGSPFRVGSDVAWRLRPVDGLDWLDTALAPEVAPKVDAVEDHHLNDADPTPATVVSIATVHCDFAPEPVAGSALMAQVDAAERWTGKSGGREFAGFLVELRPR